jgi:broad specificity phosphatase PhoE
MRVGLVRHFQVSEALPTEWLTSAELQDWRQRYDRAPVCPIPVADEAGNWDLCFSSDLPRAEQTARAIYSRDVVLLQELREVEFAPFQTGELRLSVRVWSWILRLAWLTGHASQKCFRDDFRSRVRAVADRIEQRGGDLLIVSHAGMMLFLRKELLNRGFHGPKLGIAEHAKVYVFCRE